MAKSSENMVIEKIYNYKGEFYKVIENAEFHNRLQSDPSLMDLYFNDDQVDKESANLISENNETTDANKENFYWNNENTKLLLHLFQERYEKFRDPKIKKKTLWTEMAVEFGKHNYKNVPEDILDRKMRNMKKTYRTIKDNQKLTGRGRITWEYFEIFENMFFDDKTINTGPTFSSMQLQPQGSKGIVKQRTSESSDNCDLINIPSRDLKTPQYNSNLKNWTLSKCSILPSTNSKVSSIASTSSSDAYDFTSLTEEHTSDSNDPLPLMNIDELYEKDVDGKCTPPRRKPYSMKDTAVRTRALYQRRHKNEDIEKDRLKEITELRKTFEKNNEIQEDRNKLLQDLLKELKTSK